MRRSHLIYQSSWLTCCFNVNVNKMNTHCWMKNRPRNLMAVLKKNLLLSTSFVSVCVYVKMYYTYMYIDTLRYWYLHTRKCNFKSTFTRKSTLSYFQTPPQKNISLRGKITIAVELNKLSLLFFFPSTYFPLYLVSSVTENILRHTP